MPTNKASPTPQATMLTLMPSDTLAGGGWMVLAWAGSDDRDWWHKVSPVVAWGIGGTELHPLAPAIPAEALADGRWAALPPASKPDDSVVCRLGAFDTLGELIAAARQAWEDATGRRARLPRVAEVEPKREPRKMPGADMKAIGPRRPRRIA